MTVEVKTKLTLDDHASSGLSGITRGFEEMHEHAEQAAEGFSVLKMVAAEFFEHVLEVGIDKAKELGEGLVEAAESGQQFEQRMAGMEAAVQGIDWDAAKHDAGEFLEETAAAAQRTHTPIDELRAGFAKLVEIQGATPDGINHASDQIEQMARVANVLGTSVETISSQFAFMEEGAIKVKSQMFQLLQPTGIFEHHGMKATEYWQKLSNESRAQLLAKGLEEISSRMEKATPTFKDTVTQLENVWTDAKERLGGPAVEALQPHLERLVKLVSKSEGSLDEWGRELGDKVGEWVEEAAQEVKAGFDFIQEHEAEIGKDIKEAWGYAKEVVEFIVRHKEAIALIGGAKMVLGSEGAKGAFNAASGLAKGVYQAGAVGEGAALGGGIAGGALALGAFTAAIGASILALKQWDDLMAITGGGKSDARMSYEAIEKQLADMTKAPDMSQWGAKNLEQFDHMRANLVRLADDLGESSSAAGDLADRAFEAHRKVRELVEPIDRAAEALEQMGGAGADKDWSKQDELVGQISSGFSNAMQAQNAGVEQYIANMLAGNQALQTAFLQSGEMSADGFNALADMLKDSAKEFSEQLRSKAALAGGGPKEAKPTVNFNGGQTFKIQQDFRNEDPDRIAVIFRQDVLKSSERRVQANTSTPFGF